MYRVTIIEKGDRSSVIAYNTPEPFMKGANIEKYTRDNVFTGAHFKMIHKPFSNTDIQHDITENLLKPAFRFRDKQTGTEFYLETKFRTSLYLDKIEWTYPDQLICYQECQKEIPVFILLGLGNAPENPCRLFLMPLEKAKTTGVYLSEARKYENSKGVPVSSVELWGRMGL
jgi:hypothetical protein